MDELGYTILIRNMNEAANELDSDTTRSILTKLGVENVDERIAGIKSLIDQFVEILGVIKQDIIEDKTNLGSKIYNLVSDLDGLGPQIAPPLQEMLEEAEPKLKEIKFDINISHEDLEELRERRQSDLAENEPLSKEISEGLQVLSGNFDLEDEVCSQEVEKLIRYNELKDRLDDVRAVLEQIRNITGSFVTESILLDIAAKYPDDTQEKSP